MDLPVTSASSARAGETSEDLVGESRPKPGSRRLGSPIRLAANTALLPVKQEPFSTCLLINAQLSLIALRYCSTTR